MTSESDLYTLKELLQLRGSLHLATGALVDRHNALVEWAVRTYWTVSAAAAAPCASIDTYYERRRRPCELPPGEYVVSRLHFGVTHAWVRGAVIRASGAQVDPPEGVRAACEELDRRFADLAFVRFSVFCHRWVADDAVAARSASDAVLAAAREAGLATAASLRLRVAEGERFGEEDFRAVHHALRAAGDAGNGTAVCASRPGEQRRVLLDLAPRSFVRVRRVELCAVDERHRIPVLRTATGARALCRDVGHLVDARARAGAFVAVRRFPGCLVLCDEAAQGCGVASREDALRAIVRQFGPDCAVSDGFVVRVRDSDARSMAARLGLAAPCASLAELAAAVRASAALRRRLRDGGAIKLACECMGYPHQEAIALINNMRFSVGEDGAIRSFSLDNAACLGNPTAETIYASFPQFVAVFNLLSALAPR